MTDSTPVPASEAGQQHPSWRRVVLKLSGGLFAGTEPLGISPDVVQHLAEEIVAATSDGIQVAAVVGGGAYMAGKSAANRSADKPHPPARPA